MAERTLRTKKKRLICAVKGCRNRESYSITKGGDFAGTPNLCADCLQKAYAAVFPDTETGDMETDVQGAKEQAGGGEKA